MPIAVRAEKMLKIEAKGSILPTDAVRRIFLFIFHKWRLWRQEIYLNKPKYEIVVLLVYLILYQYQKHNKYDNIWSFLPGILKYFNVISYAHLSTNEIKTSRLAAEMIILKW